MGRRPWHDFTQDYHKASRQARSQESGMVCSGLEHEGRQVLPSSVLLLLECIYDVQRTHHNQNQHHSFEYRSAFANQSRLLQILVI